MIDSLKQYLDDLKGKRVKYYTVLNYTLDVARSNESIFIAGSYVYVLNLDGTAKIKLNEISGDDIDLFKYRQIASPFYRIFLTHTAQATKVLSLAIGVSSEVFSLQDFQSPDMGAIASDISDLKKTDAYNYGTQVSKSNIAINVTVIIHTVTTGKTLILEHYNIQAAFTTGAQLAGLFVTDASDVTQYNLAQIPNDAGTWGYGSQSQIVLSIPEGYKIKLISSATNTRVYGFIKGREV